MKTKLTALYATMGLAICSVMVCMAEVGLDEFQTWATHQLTLLILIVGAGLAIMFFVQKQTVKAVVAILSAGLLYLVTSQAETVFSNLGEAIGSWFGLS